jgi:hypothetical protein
MMNDSHVVYRHFDAQGRLLYVGRSNNWADRTRSHRKYSHWFKSVANMSVEHFDTHAQCVAAEAEAIRRERPLFNIALNDGAPKRSCVYEHKEIKTPEQRSLLKARREPYWHKVQARGYVGFRRLDEGGTWIARFYANGKQEYRALDLAGPDDADAFDRAVRAAGLWFRANTFPQPRGTRLSLLAQVAA